MIRTGARLSLLVALVLGVALVPGSSAGRDVAGPSRAASGEPDSAVAAARKRRPARVLRDAGGIRDTVRRFRKLLGPYNGGAPRGQAGGRREINWDAVPDDLAAPNELPAEFFNARTAPRARGAVLKTPGDHVAVSADASNPAGAAVRFGDINPAYSNQFKTFSPERLFSPVGSNVVNLRFRVPGTSTRAVVRGFGAVYTDIDARHNTAFQYFDSRGRSLGKFSAPVSKRGLSFLGVIFRKALVARVRIAYGNGKLGPDETARYDVAVMDDFLYAEPRRANK
jgi:hypothetical protein